MPIKIDGMSTSGPSVTVLRMNDERTREADWDFSSELLDQEEALSAEQLEKLMRQIDDQGARLSRTPTYEELRSYRSLIQRFVGEAVNNMYELKNQSGWDRMGRRKVYTVVRKIDKKLEEMAEQIRLGQATQLSIIESHDAIRGLLVDLYM